MPLTASLGRILARSIYADHPQPSFDRSPPDGYALRAADIAGSAHDTPAVLAVVDTLYAGDVASIPTLQGQAVRLMTGSMIPQCADCVIRQEDTDEGERVVQIFQTVSAGSNICYRGEKYQAGECLISAGQQLDAAAFPWARRI